MFVYEKKLQFPVNIRNTNPKLASIILFQYGGPDGLRQGAGGTPCPKASPGHSSQETKTGVTVFSHSGRMSGKGIRRHAISPTGRNDHCFASDSFFCR